MKKITASCLCGEVSFVTEAEPLWCAHCHCTLCQAAHGAAFVTWVGFRRDAVDICADKLQWFKSSAEGERGFCSRCGTTVFFRSSNWAGEIHLARSLIDGELDLQPNGHAFYDTHVDWVNVRDDLPIL